MAKQTLEERVAHLESLVAELQRSQISKVRTTKKSWRDTIGMFSGDEGMLEIFEEAAKLREADRAKTKPKPKAKRDRK